MMLGNILWNFWLALGSFTVYFLVMFQKSDSPFNILLGSFIFAVVGFVIMYAVRYLIGFILYTPEKIDLLSLEVKVDSQTNENLSSSQNKTTTKKEISKSSEEIARVIRTLMDE